MFRTLPRSLSPIKKALFHPESMAVIFSLRTILASSLALIIAFALKLDSPQWAALTVWIVAQPSRGSTFSKGFYRFLGTCVGSVVALFLITYLDTSPWIFVLTLALWMGICSWAAVLVRYFRSYGAVLAGYTATIVGILVFDHAEKIEEVARARVICVFLGIAVATVFSLAPGNERNKNKLFGKLRDCISKLTYWLHLISTQAEQDQINSIQKELLFEMASIEEALNHAAAESMQIRMRTKAIQNLIASFISVMSSLSALDVLLKRKTTPEPGLQESLTWIAGHAQKVSVEIKKQNLAKDTNLDNLVLELQTLSDHLTINKTKSSILAERLKDLSSRFLEVSKGYESLYVEKSKLPLPQSLTHYRDWRFARLAAIRSLIGVIVAGAIWILTGWHSGPLLVMIAAVNCGLFATRANPSSALTTTIKSSLVAYAAALVCNLLVLNSSHEILILLVQVICLFPGGLLIATANTNLAGAIFSSNYLLFFSPSLPMHFDWSHFFDLGIGYFAGSAVSLLAFRVVASPTPDQRMTDIKEEILFDLKRMASGKYNTRFDLWQPIMYTRISQLIKLSVDSHENTAQTIDRGLAALYLGKQILRVQLLLNEKKALLAHISDAFALAFENVSENPKSSAENLYEISIQLEKMSAQEIVDHNLCQQIIAVLMEMADELHTWAR